MEQFRFPQWVLTFTFSASKRLCSSIIVEFMIIPKWNLLQLSDIRKKKFASINLYICQILLLSLRSHQPTQVTSGIVDTKVSIEFHKSRNKWKICIEMKFLICSIFRPDNNNLMRYRCIIFCRPYLLYKNESHNSTPVLIWSIFFLNVQGWFLRL